MSGNASTKLRHKLNETLLTVNANYFVEAKQLYVYANALFVARESTFDMLSDDTEDEVDAESSGPPKLPPDITLVLRNRDVKEGGVTKFACRVVSRSAMTAEWYKDEQLVSKWPRFTSERDEDLFALTISDAKRTDAGHIRFVARNEFGQVESNAYLNVERE